MKKKPGQPKPLRHLRYWFIGAVAGWLIWGAALGGVYAIEAASIPSEWQEIVGNVQMVLILMIAPVSLGGWLFIWGDNGPPYAWLDSPALNLTLTFCLHGLFGALIGGLIGWWRRSRRLPGHCVSCGYDLRGSPGPCPGCGMPPTTAAKRGDTAQSTSESEGTSE